MIPRHALTKFIIPFLTINILTENIKTVLSDDPYSSESWLVDLASAKQTSSKTTWVLKVTSTDPRKTCNIMARGAEPKLVALPMSTKSEIVMIIPAQDKTDLTSCYFEFDIDVVAEFYRKVEIVIEELILENINTRVKHSRFQLPNY